MPESSLLSTDVSPISDNRTSKVDEECLPLREVDSGKGSSLRRNISGSSTHTISSSEDSSGTASPSEKGTLTPPDGGWGWVVVFASFMMSLIADGVSLSFGILFVELDNYFSEGKSKAAWVGSLFLSMPLLTGPIASALTDRYGCRIVSIFGGLLAAAGFVLSVFCHSLELLCLTFSISGFGLALCYVTSIVIVAYYFEKKRSLATGLAVCGTGVGTLIFAPFTIYLLETYAWRGTLLILSGFFLNIVVFGALMRDLEDTIRSTDRPKDNSDNEELLKLSPSNGLHTHHAANLDRIDERLCSSLLQLPTYFRSGSVPVEVISEMSNREGGYLNTLLEQYPTILNSLIVSPEDEHTFTVKSMPPMISTLDTVVKMPGGEINGRTTVKCIQNEEQSKNCSRRQSSCPTSQRNSISSKSFAHRRDSAYLHRIRLERGSLTYKGAMLNIRRYRLRASSCPDIYRNSMMTIADEDKPFQFLWDIKDMVTDMVDFSIFKNLRYTLFCVSNFLLYACVDVPYMYIPDDAINGGVDKESASLLISIIGILNTIGVVIVGYIGDKPWLDASVLYSIFITISGAVIAILPWVKNYAGMAFITAVYGFTISANYTLVSVIIVNLISLDSFTNAYGLLLLAQGLASLVGPPLAGWMYDLTGSYDATFFVTGIVTLISGIIVLPVSKSSKEGSSSSSSSSTSSPHPSAKGSAERLQRTERVRFKSESEDDSACFSHRNGLNQDIAIICNGSLNANDPVVVKDILPESEHLLGSNLDEMTGTSQNATKTNLNAEGSQSNEAAVSNNIASTEGMENAKPPG